MAAEIARTHHERWDGNGYSAGLAGDEIPLSGRITALADVWDTLTHERPYKPAWDEERALAEIYEQSGHHFDPRVVEAFSTIDRHAPRGPRRRRSRRPSRLTTDPPGGGQSAGQLISPPR